MFFNSIDFAFFLPICFIVYWLIGSRNISLQNKFLVIISYLFYGWWDWKFLTLIIASTIVDFFISKNLGEIQNKKVRKRLLYFSLTFNIGMLAFFKYSNFFIENFTEAFSLLGTNFNISSLNIILPVGISFYTFQTLSYTIDVYRQKITPTNNFIAFTAFVSFFPQLVAGPIERASNLLPQFLTKRKFHYVNAVSGLKQILWGIFKKVVIADNCAEYANLIFNNYLDYTGYGLLLGSIFFAFQIYGDFSGYTDIAIGTAKLFDFKLNQNFSYPYFSRNIAEFWRRWHISLSTWFRDYIYIPLGGSKVSKTKVIRNVFIIFIVSGFWHGPNWTFIVWGLINALFFLPTLLSKKNRKYLEIVDSKRSLPTIKSLLQIFSTFLITCFAWIFFRVENMTIGISYVKSLFIGLSSKQSLIDFINLIVWEINIIIPTLLAIFITIEWKGRRETFAIEKLGCKLPKILRWSLYSMLIVLIGVYMKSSENSFIYFQF